MTEVQLPVLLYGRTDVSNAGSAGAAIAEHLLRRKWAPAPRAWDLLSIALSVITADYAVLRTVSPDGWTREIELLIAVREPDFWDTQSTCIAEMLSFLTTDRWSVAFTDGGYEPRTPKKVIVPQEASVVLLSGGIDSLIGTLDLVVSGDKPLAVSQIVAGDRQKQATFAAQIGGGLTHLQMNHNADAPGANERSQRARSIIFLTYGALAATTLQAFRDGAAIPVHISENGLISINPPLTDARLGSLSTRTTHPVYLSIFQELLKAAELPIVFRTPYQFSTKGEMMLNCANQRYLKHTAHDTTSCGRYSRNGFRHCGRCVPCLIRRAAFHRWSELDTTDYVYQDLGKNDADHAMFDDVRSAAMGIATAKADGVDAIIGASLASARIENLAPYRAVVERGLDELEAYLTSVGVR